MCHVTQVARAQLAEPARPANDDFADAIVVTGSSPEGRGSLLGSTLEPGESSSLSFGSIWWSWTPPEEGFYAIQIAGDGQAEPGWGYGQYYYHSPDISVVRAETIAEARMDEASVVRVWGFERFAVFAVSKNVHYRVSLSGPSADATQYSFLMEPVAGPAMQEQPKAENTFEGGSAVFAAGSRFLLGQRSIYQWQHNGVDLPGQNAHILLLTNVASADAGWYRLSVTWTLPSGKQVSAMSQSAGLVVARPPTPVSLADGLDQNRNYFFHVPAWDGFPFEIEASTDLVHWQKAEHLFDRRHFQRSTTDLVWDETVRKMTYAWDERKDRWMLKDRLVGASESSLESPTRRFVRIRSEWPATHRCINQLRAIAMAKRMWGSDNGRRRGDATIVSEVDDYIGHQLICPSSGVYTYREVGPLPMCSIPGHVLPDVD